MTPSDATRLKKLLWAGALPSRLAKSFRPTLTPGAIYHVRAGLRWGSVPWPDGSMGGLSPARRDKIAAARANTRVTVR